MNFVKFMKENRSRIRKTVMANTKKNEKGQTVIIKDDPWLQEIEWDEQFKLKQKDAMKK